MSNKFLKEYVYWYKGPVVVFDKLSSNTWSGMTVAVSEKKARSNLAYQYRQQAGLSRSTPVKFTEPIYRKV